jgi:SAM-dependent methyltransferase
VLDVGCGLGVYLLFLESLGAKRVVGIDGVAGSRSILAEEHYLQHDLSQRFHTGETYDLVTCTEVAEHLEKSASRRLLASLAAHAKEHILFSAADTGQPGEGPMSCKPTEFWIERWEKLGWEPDTIASLSFRALSTYSWFRRNTLVLRRIGTGRRNDESAFPDLSAIGRTEHKWFPQAPRVYEYPFTGDVPDVGGSL